MKKTVLLITFLSLSMTACQDEKGTTVVGPQHPPEAGWNQTQQKYMDCPQQTINTYNRVIQNSRDFAWNGRIRHLQNLLAACGQLKELFRDQSCMARDLSTGQLMPFGFENVQQQCDQANVYSQHDQGRAGTSGKTGSERQESFGLETLKDKGIRAADSEPEPESDAEANPTPQAEPSPAPQEDQTLPEESASPARPNPPKRSGTGT